MEVNAGFLNVIVNNVQVNTPAQVQFIAVQVCKYYKIIL